MLQSVTSQLLQSLLKSEKKSKFHFKDCNDE